MPATVASVDAYTKALLHAYKCPAQAVMGLLAGKRIAGAGGTDDCYVTEAYPLFHALPVSAPHPLLEIAYTHCEAAANSSGLTLLGVYFANERLDDHSIAKELTRPVLEFFAARMGLSTSEGGRDRLLVWFLDNEALTSPPTALAVTSFYYFSGAYERNSSSSTAAAASSPSAGSWIPRPSSCMPGSSPASPLTTFTFGRWNSDTLAPEATVPLEAAVEATTNALEAFAQYRLADLEDHLENPSANYLEQPLAMLIKRR